MDDLIKRADAIEALDRIGSLDTDADREYARSIIKALPSADAVQGEWITCHDVDHNTDIYQCNKCHKVNWYPSNFCPSCGAIMKGGAE